jgi:hypothetical protein
MRYKIGDRVFIKPWKLMEKEFGQLCEDITTTSSLFTKQMESQLKGRNRIVTINYIGLGGYHVILDGETEVWTSKVCGAWTITDDMIAGYAFDYDEEIEVSDSGYVWRNKLYIGFAPGKACPYLTNFAYHRYARPIRKPEIEIAVKINGRDAKLSDISEETLRNIRNKENRR